MRIFAKIYSTLFMVISLAALVALVTATVIIMKGKMGGVILLMPHFWVFVAVYAFLPILFCIGLSLRSRASLGSRAYTVIGMICLLPWMGGMMGMMMTMPIIAPRVEQHVLQMDFINRMTPKLGTTQPAAALPNNPPTPQ